MRRLAVREPRLLQPAFVAICVYSFLTMVAFAALLPVLPLFVQGPLHGSAVATGIVMSSPLIAGAVLQPQLGRFGDRHGRRILLIVGPLLFGGAILNLSLVDTPALACVVRGVAGIGDAAFVLGAITVVNDLAPPERRGEAYNISSIATWAGMGSGSVAGDFLARTYSFNAVWVLCLVVGAAASAVAAFVPETRASVGGTPPRSFLRHVLGVPNTVLACEMCGFAAFMVFTPLYARTLGMRGAGLVLLVNALVIIAVRILGRTLPDRLGGRRAAAAGVVFGAIGVAVPALTNDVPGLFIGAACFGAGHALLYPAVVMLAVAAARDDERSAAVGGLRASEAFGFAVSAPLLGVIAAHAGYRSAFGVAAVVTAGGIAALAVARRGERRAETKLTFDVR